MIISNQIEHLRNLFKELKYAKVIQFGKISLSISLKEKRYADALTCYEYTASAYFETGNFERFLVVMDDYEKLCLTYGEDRNKMVFYYLLSLLQIIVKNYDESLVAIKTSIRYAHSLKRYELIVINYSNVAALLAFTDQPEKAKIAMQLANYYKQKITHLNNTIIRGSSGALFYFAVTKDSEAFQKTKEDFNQRLTGNHSYYYACMNLAEAILKINLGFAQDSILLFEQAFQQLKANENNLLLVIVEKCIERFQLQEQFQYANELRRIVENTKQLNPRNIQSAYNDFFMGDLSAIPFKYPNILTKELAIEYVEQALSKDEALYCIHWSFVTEKSEKMFGELFVEQLLFPLFETIYQQIFQYDAKVTILSKNEGEAFLKNIMETDFIALLVALEEKLQSAVAQSTLGAIEIPIHFGIIHSTQLPKDEVSYEQLVAFAAASLYYAKSHEQLYIKS